MQQRRKTQDLRHFLLANLDSLATTEATKEKVATTIKEMATSIAEQLAQYSI